MLVVLDRAELFFGLTIEERGQDPGALGENERVERERGVSKVPNRRRNGRLLHLPQMACQLLSSAMS